MTSGITGRRWTPSSDWLCAGRMSWGRATGPDADMLPVGHMSIGSRSVGPDRQSRFTHSEQQTLLSFWALLPAPLMVGADLPDNDPWTLAPADQPGSAGRRSGRRRHGGPNEVLQRDEGEVWTRTLADGSVVVGLFNRGRFRRHPDGYLVRTVSQWPLSYPGSVAAQESRDRPISRFPRSCLGHGAVLLLLKACFRRRDDGWCGSWEEKMPGGEKPPGIFITQDAIFSPIIFATASNRSRSSHWRVISHGGAFSGAVQRESPCEERRARPDGGDL